MQQNPQKTHTSPGAPGAVNPSLIEGLTCLAYGGQLSPVFAPNDRAAGLADTACDFYLRERAPKIAIELEQPVDLLVCVKNRAVMPAERAADSRQRHTRAPTYKHRNLTRQHDSLFASTSREIADWHAEEVSDDPLNLFDLL